jgi:hypothetical protein
MATELHKLGARLDQQGLVLRQIAARGHCDPEDLAQMRELFPHTYRRIEEYNRGIGEETPLRKMAADGLLPARFIGMFL